MAFERNRAERRTKALRHTEEMKRLFSDEIKKCIENSTVYGGNKSMPAEKGTENHSKFLYRNTDTVSAIKEAREKHPNSKIAALNFASYKHPGGLFIDGAMAQEEALCHASFLYNVLSEFPDYYGYNNSHKNKALYTDRAIYSPNVKFISGDDSVLCDIITCACPNKGAAKRWCHVTDEENRTLVRNRIRFIKDIAKEQNVEYLILGAFGCGVFKQDPVEVADIFAEVFEKSSVKEIVMAVPGNNKNTAVFQTKFKKTDG